MAATLLTATRPTVSPRQLFPPKTARVPWYIWCGVFGITSSSIGILWDISWHISIGRDSFWTPAHMAIYLCGVLAGLTCGYLILATTFGRSPAMKAASVQVLGFRAPLGAFIAAWGGTAMLTSAPFDNWWHAAYGLDAKVITPPHTLLFLGMRGVTVGILTLILATMNRAADQGATNFTALRRLLLFVGGLLITDQMVLVSAYTNKFYLHYTHGYVLSAILILPVLALLSQISRSRWPATTATSVYTVVILGLLWILPLFPAQPRLGPVYTQVTHMIPPTFPLLLVLPALALDFFWQRAGRLNLAMQALASAAIFTLVLVAFEWPFADFLMSHRSENYFFGTLYFPFIARPADRIPVFHLAQHGLPLVAGLSEAVGLGFVACWIAFGLGRWMRGVQR